MIATTSRPKAESCCCKLRWKGMYIDVEPDPTVPNMRDGLFWCSTTMTCLGPDGRVADEESCCEGRVCHEPW
jgi:hypothetical protein